MHGMRFMRRSVSDDAISLINRTTPLPDVPINSIELTEKAVAIKGVTE